MSHLNQEQTTKSGGFISGPANRRAPLKPIPPAGRVRAANEGGSMSCHLGWRLPSPPSPAMWGGAMSGGAGMCNGSRKIHMSETPRIERMPCGQYPASRHAGVTRQGRDGQGRATRTGRGMAGSGRDGQAPAAAGRIVLAGSGGGRRRRPKLERGARQRRADALNRYSASRKRSPQTGSIS